MRRGKVGLIVFGWLLRLIRSYRTSSRILEATASDQPLQDAATSEPATSGVEAGFADVFAGVDFDPEAAPKPGLAWLPGRPLFSAAERADVVACDPVEVTTLASTIISELLASIDKVPPFPLIANRLIALSSQPDVRVDIVERLVEQDAVIAAKVIGAANALLFDQTSPVESVNHAIRVVGLEEVTQIAIAAAAAAVFDTKERVAFEAMTVQQQAAWAHSLATAKGAAALAQWLGADVQGAYIAGLLHDIGKPVALRGIGFALINGRLANVPSAALAIAAVEEAHVDVGAMLADAWSLGEEIGRVIEQHHEDDVESQLVRIVRMASAVDELRTNPGQSDDLLAQALALAMTLGLTKEKLSELSDEMGRTSTLFA